MMQGGGNIEYQGNCLTIIDAKNVKGSHLTMAPCQGLWNQKWTMDTQNMLHSGYWCLDSGGHASTAGSPLDMWDCSLDPKRQWTPNIIEGTNTFELINKVNLAAAVDVSNGIGGDAMLETINVANPAQGLIFVPTS